VNQKNKISAALAVIYLSCLFCNGCHNPKEHYRGVEAVIEGGGKFPEFLVGRWKADEYGWEFVFGPDGSISSMIHTIGRVEIRPGRTTTIPMIMKGKGVFEPGECTVYYAPAERELTVTISLKHFYADLGKNVLEGKSTDIFVGEVTANGKAWVAEWTAFPEYIATTGTYKHYKLPEDNNNPNITSLLFEKVSSN